jgi:hypothetical protein
VKVDPEYLSDADAAVAYSGGRFTEAHLKQAWRTVRHFSFGLMQPRGRCKRLQGKGLLAKVPGPRGGRSWEFTRLAQQHCPDLFTSPGVFTAACGRGGKLE